MRVVGSKGESATSRPPKPQPMSAISTRLVTCGGVVGGDRVLVVVGEMKAG